jgi:hypothetical protein
MLELAAKNPSIETLIMSNCHNISDDGVISAVKHLSRLKHLELEVSVTFWISTNIESSRIKYINLVHNMLRLLMIRYAAQNGNNSTWFL